MSWKSNHSKVRPLVRAAFLTAALVPALAGTTRAAPTDADSSFARSIIFAVDPVLGQAYLASAVSEDRPEGSIAVLSLASRREIGSIPYTAAPSAVAVNPITGLVYIASKTQDTISVVHGPTLRVVTTAKISGGPQVLLLEPTSGRLFVGLARERSIKVLDISTLSTLGTVDLGMEPAALAFDRVRNRLIAVSLNVEPEPAALSAIDNDRLTVINQMSLPERPDGLAVLDGIGRVYVPLAPEGDILVIDA
jgi:DNA-binding beta-propeller fold protein YncE